MTTTIKNTPELKNAIDAAHQRYLLVQELITLSLASPNKRAAEIAHELAEGYEVPLPEAQDIAA